MHFLNKDCFLASWKVLYDTVFSGKYVDEGCFRDPKWRQVLLPTHLIRAIDQVVFVALEKAVREAEVKGDVVLTEVEGPFHESVCLSFEKDELDRAWGNYSFDSLDSVVFGKSATWGMFVAYDDFTCVGGTNVFMRKFLDEVDGGEERLKTDFFENADWCIDPPIKEEILQRVGWR